MTVPVPASILLRAEVIGSVLGTPSVAIGGSRLDRSPSAGWKLAPQDVARFRLEANMFHRAVERAERDLDDNEQSQKRLQREQDGSEVKSVQLERLIERGQSLIEQRDSLEVFRDSAADRYLRTTGSPWSQRTGSRVSHRHLTAAMIDSRDFIAARKRARERRPHPLEK